VPFRKAVKARGGVKRAKSFREMLMQCARGNASIFAASICKIAFYGLALPLRR
jgi:hypothetical protein